MTWTYDSTDPTGTDKDHVRFIVGDVVETAKYTLTDEEITAMLTAGGTVHAASITCARSLAARWAREPSVKIGRTQVTQGDVASRLEKLADRLVHQGSESAVPYVGGISIADKDARLSDSDAVQPRFLRDRDDMATRFDNLNPRASWEN